jgi:hypothetical protein
MSTPQFRVGDRVVKNPTGWIPSAFDAWGAGEGVGVVLGVYEQQTGVPSLGEYDVRWPAGRATQAQAELLPAPPDP